MTDAADLILAGDTRLAARLMRALDDGVPRAYEILGRLYDRTGGTRRIGITGHPGVGKSTLTDRLVTAYRAAGKRVGVVAIDPSSPYTGGAILGDRVRMQKHAGDEGVFIRSLATRGALGGLSAGARDTVYVMEAMGFDIILVETVGVGQDEVDVANLVESSVVVTVPGLGDSVQAIKAGILEIADIFVVNKADHPDADRAANHLHLILDLEGGERHGRPVPVLKTIAQTGEGIDALCDALTSHEEHLATTPEGARRAQRRSEVALLERVELLLRAKARAAVAAHGGIHEVVNAIQDKTLDPYRAARQVVDAIES